MPVQFADSVAARIGEAHGLAREQIAITCSHTHSGPPLHTIENRIVYPIDSEQEADLECYTESVGDKIVALAGRLMETLRPVELAYGTGRADFAVNRRNNKEADTVKPEFEAKGPVDHDVPVLRVSDEDGKLMAVVFGYACHCTTMSFYKWCGDYAGFAQSHLEEEHPEATALFVAGCGADINPMPRGELEYCKDYGKRLAAAVEDTLMAPMQPVTGKISARLERIALAFDALPDREKLRNDLEGENKYYAKRAAILLERMDRGIPLSPTYPYPVQTLQFGDSLTTIILGGEVVVDYAIRLKKELGANDTWVVAYANDLCAYVPSERVLLEGGYEGGGAMVYFARPAPWAPGLEQQIVGTVNRLLAVD